MTNGAASPQSLSENARLGNPAYRQGAFCALPVGGVPTRGGMSHFSDRLLKVDLLARGSTRVPRVGFGVPPKPSPIL